VREKGREREREIVCSFEYFFYTDALSRFERQTHLATQKIEFIELRARGREGREREREKGRERGEIEREREKSNGCKTAFK
jgi:hypothetical protein